MRLRRKYTVRGVHDGPAEVLEPRPAVAESSFHAAYLGREPEQVRDAREQVQREVDLRTGKITKYREGAE